MPLGGISGHGCTAISRRLCAIVGNANGRRRFALRSILLSTWTSTVWVKIGGDMVYMPDGESGESVTEAKGRRAERHHGLCRLGRERQELLFMGTYPLSVCRGGTSHYIEESML